jgi:hypothetical protein
MLEASKRPTAREVLNYLGDLKTSSGNTSTGLNTQSDRMEVISLEVNTSTIFSFIINYTYFFFSKIRPTKVVICFQSMSMESFLWIFSIYACYFVK